MDLPGIIVPEEERVVLTKRYLNGTSTEHRSLQAALKALDEGRQLVSLQHIMRNPLGNHEPKLGFAPPWAKVCRVHIARDRAVTFRARRGMQRWSMRFATGVAYRPEVRRGDRGRTKVPPIPPDIRPLVQPGSLVVWEAHWSMRLPKDPALLNPIGGDLYHVAAVWELTDLERHILGG